MPSIDRYIPIQILGMYRVSKLIERLGLTECFNILAIP
jgi:hypothetical protein